ncbi:MAG: hypothetical protein ACLUNQ_00265 [Oscillospiraceae bacterium]
MDFTSTARKPAFSLDQKYNRQAVARLAKGRTVLDCFTHTGSFALNAAAEGGATCDGGGCVRVCRPMCRGKRPA